MELFSDVRGPNDDELADRYRQIEQLLGKGASERAAKDAFAAWEGIRRIWTSFANVTRLRFAQDTTKAETRAAQRTLDERTPSVMALETAAKKQFLAGDVRRSLEAEVGGHAFDVWSADLDCFDPAIANDLVREASLTRQYTELLASATAPFEGAELTLSALAPYFSDADRDRRHAAETARWSIFEGNAERLDSLYDELVHLRDGMARQLGFSDYTTLRYRRMRRIDYGPSDVSAYREAVVKHVVPLATYRLRTFGAQAGLNRVFFWDETAVTARSRVLPMGELDWTVDRTREALRAIDPALGTFGDDLFDGGMFDVAYRPGKGRGAFCTDIPVRNRPFIFANYAGSARDVRTLMHELGHAFQRWQSRDKDVLDYMYPTSEAAEIHSMTLEFLSWPEMERFFGDGAEAYRRQHLFDSLLFIPYGTAIDHFQHLVYANPSASPSERHAMWRELELTYLPWRDYGDLGHPAKGGLWQEKQHVYLSPFYYIDYTLALCCALQFWDQAAQHRGDALERYVALCRRGGEAPFQSLLRSAGLRSPFESGTLETVVARVRSALA